MAPACRGCGRAMVDYRIYCLDGAGHISFAKEMTANTDHEAIAAALSLNKDALKCEVWKGRHLVATLNAQDLSD